MPIRTSLGTRYKILTNLCMAIFMSNSTVLKRFVSKQTFYILTSNFNVNI